ncbi:MAG: DNA repair protein RecO [Myxococcales bacterium]|nr:DNA repair protein RecO [Myxococcales bacterium]
MAGIRTEAVVLRSVDFAESDRIVHLLVPDTGRLTAIAKGARRSVRRFPGTLDLFNHLRVQLQTRRSGAMARLEQATLIESFTPLRHETRRFAIACYLLEVLDRLAPEAGARDDMRRLFRFALAALRAAATRKPDARLRVLIELRALEALGLRPELRRCVRCAAELGGAAQVDFHVADGGTLCGRCAAPLDGLLRVHVGTLRALEQGLRFDFEHLDRLVLGPVALAESRQLVGRFQRFHVGVDLRSERFLNEMLPA